MTINFTNYPAATNRVPGVYAEIDASLANTGTTNQRTLIIGQKTSAGTATAAVPVLCAGLGDAKDKGGAGSQLALMFAAYRQHDQFGEVWLAALADAGSSVAATGTIALTGTATEAGTLFVYIGGTRVAVPVASGDTAAVVAAALDDLVNANVDLPVTAGVSTGTVTLTANNAGTNGNEIDIRLNYLGAAGGEKTPAGISAVITAMASGATDPVLTTLIANLGDQEYDFIVTPYADTTNLNSLKTALDDTTGRWSWSQQIFGHVFAAKRGAFNTLTSFGEARNDQHASVIGFYDSPTPAWIWAAAFAGAAAVSLRADPALPVTHIPLQVKAPPVASRFDMSERNTLLYAGLSTFRVDAAGQVALERATTTYQVNGAGQEDNSYLDIETMFTLMYIVRFMVASLGSKFARKKIVSDNSRISGAASNVVTTAVIRAQNIADYRKLEAAGYVQDGDGYTTNVQVENAGNGLVKILAPVRLANQLRQIAMLVQFTKP